MEKSLSSSSMIARDNRVHICLLLYVYLLKRILCTNVFCFYRGTVLNNNNKGKWFKFNDTIVEEFEMSDAMLEAECFGGTYKAKVYDNSKYIG